MDRGDRFSGYHRHAKQPQTSYGLNMQGNSLDQNAAVNFRNVMNMMNANSLLRATQHEKKEQKVPHAPAVREQDQYMPIANVIRIMRRILPPHAKISDDAKETIQECVSEYISFITGEANERCQREQRKTITAEDVLWAMGKLGFDDYVEPLTLFINRYRESESDRPLTRDGMLKRNAADHGYPLPAYVPPYAMAPPPQGPYDGTMPMAYYRDPLGSAGSGSSSQNNPPNYDSFGQFKG